MKKNNIYTEKFCGVDLLNWKEWDEVYTGMMQFYDVEFIPESMEKYNGMTVSKTFEGELKVYDKDSNVVWTGYVTDIPEIMEKLIKRKENIL